MAKRIVRALSVFRLTTDDIKIKIGVTSTELRDQLFLHIDFPDLDADFLNATIWAEQAYAKHEVNVFSELARMGFKKRQKATQ